MFITPDDLREAGIDGDEIYLTKLIVRVSAMIQKYIGRQLDQQDYEEVYDGNQTGMIALRQFPVTGVTSVSVVLNDTITGFDKEDLTLEEVAKYNWSLDEDSSPTGILRINGMLNGRNKYFIKYQAGYAQLPYELEQVVIDLCGYFVNSAKSSGIKSETLGEYSITFGGTGSQTIKSLGLDSVLDLYRTPSI